MNPVQKSFKHNLLSIFFLSTLIIAAELPLSLAQTSPPEVIEGNIDDIARAILTFFPKVVGKVVAVEADRVKVDINQGEGLTSGILLTVFREQEQFLHPVTGVPLGRFEDKMGTLEVVRFEVPHLITTFTEPRGKIVVGDLVRIPATRIPIAVSMSTESEHVFLMNELVSALNDTGRFNIETLSPGTQVEAILNGPHRYHIRLSTLRDGNQFSMHLKIQNLSTGKQLDALDVLIKQSEESDLILEHLQFQLFEQRQNQ